MPSNNRSKRGERALSAPDAPRPKLLLVEDDASLASLLTLELRRKGCDVEREKNGDDAIRRLESEVFDLVVTDLKLEGADGLEVLLHARAHQPDAPVIMVTGHGSIDNAVAAMKSGAFDYMTKPIVPEELAFTIDKALEHRKLVGEVKRLRAQIQDKYSFTNFVYASPKTHNVLGLVRKVAATEASVLVTGESGTGKELISRAIHENSPRRTGPFMAINCGALPEGLLESELFGHVKGSFTGADRNKRGMFEDAAGGTIFLDEIGETTPAFQVKLLRALQEGEIRRVGDNHPIRVSTRVVAATNKDLLELVERGGFREDLYYRLKVFPIHIPALRDRPEDIIPLAEHFVRKAGKKIGSAATRIAPDAADALLDYDWPGNVRELEHAIERSLILAAGDAITLEALPPEVVGSDIPIEAGGDNLSEAERTHILRVLEAASGNQAEAAKRLGIARNTLWRKLKSYNVLK